MDLKERAKHKAKLEDPLSWPYWPILPMKRVVDGQMRAGFCVSADYPTVVMKEFLTTKGILFQLACEDSGVPLLGSDETFHADEKLKKVYEEHVEARYEDIDGLLDAGWVID